MGDIKKIRKTYDTPMHPWNAARIEEERGLHKEYGLRNKKEIWKMASQITAFKDRAKKLLARTDKQAELEREQLMARMIKLGLVKHGASFDDILGLQSRNALDRRLETMLVKKLFARTPKQARQMIVHRHVMVGGKMVTSPSYLVPVDEESTIQFSHASAFFNEQHPERFSEEELQRKKDRDAQAALKKAEKGGQKDETPPTFDESSIEKAEVLVGEKTPESESQ